jgi:DNA (cytosine-5)-methyltransferase 1
VLIGNRFGLKNPYPEVQFSKETYKSIESAMDDLKDHPRDASINHEWTAHSKKFEERISKVPPGGSLYETFRDAYKRQYKGVPSMTAKENHGGTHIHYEKNRVLSARELARLQTFPDDFIFEGTMKRAYWQIGNAVPCILAKNIALALKPSIEDLQKKKKK